MPPQKTTSDAVDKTATTATSKAGSPVLNWDRFIPFLDRRTTFYLDQKHGREELATFTLKLLPKNHTAFLEVPYVCLLNGEMHTITAPCMVEFIDERPPALVMGWKAFGGKGNIHAWMFTEGSGVLDDSKLVHIKITDILSITGPPANNLGGTKWLTQVNAYINTSSIFKALKIEKLLDIQNEWLVKADKEDDAKMFEANIARVIDAAEARMRANAKDVATKGNKVVKALEDAYIKENMSSIEHMRTAYAQMTEHFTKPDDLRFVNIAAVASKLKGIEAMDDLLKEAFSGIRCAQHAHC